MPFSISAILACTCFYSSIYLIYFYFTKNNHPFLLILAAVLLILAVMITPAAYEQKRRNRFNETLWHDHWFTYPLITWWRLFSWPIRILLSKFFD
ncbi:hypothetical protein ACK2M2_07905 [Acinetobacter sp. TY1]|uniref:hypothetical protein n=1 Tax=unclassified Acinetobacter TaxID=196816 RepID=UPI003024EEE2